jgi:hypothetical protein
MNAPQHSGWYVAKHSFMTWNLYLTNFGIVEKVSAARVVIDALSVEERKKVICNNVASDEWYDTSPTGATHDRSRNLHTKFRRKWCNPEIIFHDVGIRLEFLEQGKVDLVMGLLKVSLSEKGFEKALGAMKLNHFLGEIVHAKAILNQYSYQ